MGNIVGKRHYLLQVVLALMISVSLLAGFAGAGSLPAAHAQGGASPVQLDQGIDPEEFRNEEQIERGWRPDYLKLATGDVSALASHGVYAWPFALDSIGWNMQSYQNYGSAYFHHGIDMLKVNGTQVYNRSGGQVINVENYTPGNVLYWEVAVLDPDGYIWQYHHIDNTTIPQLIKDKFAEYQANPTTGGFIPANTYIGNIVYWTVVTFGKRFNHIHLNILGAGGAYVNGFEFHTPLPDTVGPEIQAVGLLQNNAIVSGNEIQGNYSLYVRARDLVLDTVYYIPPFEFTFAVDGGPTQTTWRFDTLPGGASDTAYLTDFFVVPPTCGDYSCRDYYIDLGFIKDSQYVFPAAGGQHTVVATVRDYAGNSASQSFTYMVNAPPVGTTVWSDNFETNLGWVRNAGGADTATSGVWERGDPAATSSSGAKQLGTTVSGTNDLVTGRLAGSSASTYDVDGGLTTMRSPAIALPTGGDLTLSFYYYLAHGTTSSTSDYLRVKVIGSTTTTVFEELGAANNDNGAWAIKNVSLNAYAGQTVRLQVEAADASSDSLVEAAVDDVLIVTSLVNQAPTANAQSVTTAEDTALGITLSGSDPDNDPLTYSVVTGPSHGTLSGTAPNLTYTPVANYNGADSFTFVVNDGHVNSTAAAVSIGITPVNDAPVANGQSVTTEQDTPVAITLAGSDIDGDPLTYSIVLDPLNGTLSGTAPDVTYTPGPAYLGSDSFTFKVNDGNADSDPAVVSITVKPVNHAPVADPQSVTTAEDTAVAITLTGSDVDGNPLTFAVQTSPSHGTLSGTGANRTYTPAANYNGADGFTFIANDGVLNSAPATVSITVNPVNDAPVANAQSVTAQQDTALAITLTGSDVDGDTLTFSVATQPSHGTLSGTAPNLTYTPASGYSGSDSFTFVANDSQVNSSPATVSITVNPAGPVTVFSDNFETNKGWTRNPGGTDTATLGLWERANPETTTSSGTKQMGTTASGSYDLVTGPLAGSGAGDYDIDGGATTIRSPSIALPAGKTLTLSFKYYLAHLNNSSSSDYLRVKVVGATTTTLLQELGAANDDDAAWASYSGSISTYAGQTVYLLIEAADASGASLVEAAVDDVLIMAQ